MTSFVNALPGAITQGMIWGVMAIGLYITYKLLEMSDLTVDGSFCTGGAVCVLMMLAGYNVCIAMRFAMLAGMLAGFGYRFLSYQVRYSSYFVRYSDTAGFVVCESGHYGYEGKPVAECQ